MNIDAINWDAATEETVCRLIELIRIDTSNPPGNELPAAVLVREFLLREGFPPDDLVLLESIPGRANLVARLRGDGSQRPLLLSGHLDVVPVERGALDMKGFLCLIYSLRLARFVGGSERGCPGGLSVTV